MIQTGRSIYRNDGFIGFFRGVASPLLALTILNTMNFSSYAYFKGAFIGKDKNVTTFEPLVFVAGAMAGPLASLVSTPFELVKIQMQVSKQYRNSLEACSSIYTNHGARAIFRGHAVNTAREMLFLGTYL